MRLIKKLPDPFLFQDGQRVVTSGDWQRRREEIRETILNLQYGTMPDAPQRVKTNTSDQVEQIDNGHTCQRLHFEFMPLQAQPEIIFDLAVKCYRPAANAVSERQAEIDGFDKDGLPTLIYVGDNQNLLATLLDSGYMVICYQNNQLEPMEEGKPIVGPARSAYQKLAQMAELPSYSWGSISVWAWGARRLLDYALTLPEVDAQRIMVSGHSRNGKTALLAGALDDRFALVNPAGSGCAGAASYLSLGEDCEDLAALTSRQRWWAWTHADFDQWAGRESELPFDQHFLMGLVAPRPLLRTEGLGDDWANPEGTVVAFLATQPIYDFLQVPDRNGIQIREGGHYQGQEDFEALRLFADWQFFDLQPAQDFKDFPFELSEVTDYFDWQQP